MTDASPRPSLLAALVYGVAASPIGLGVVLSLICTSPRDVAGFALLVVLVIPVFVAGLLGSVLDRGPTASAWAAALCGFVVVALSFQVWASFFALVMVGVEGVGRGTFVRLWVSGAVYGFVVTSPVVVPSGIVAALVLRALRAPPEQG